MNNKHLANQYLSLVFPCFSLPVSALTDTIAQQYNRRHRAVTYNIDSWNHRSTLLFSTPTSTLTNPLSEQFLKLPDAARFDGNPTNFQAFMSSMNLYFWTKPESFQIERNYIVFLGAQHAGPASVWFGNLINDNSDILQSFSLFIQEFSRNFSDPSSARDNRYNHLALVNQFLKSLNNNVMNFKIMDNLPDNLDDNIKIAIRVDNHNNTWNQLYNTLSKQQKKNKGVENSVSAFTADNPDILHLTAPSDQLREKPAPTSNSFIDYKQINLLDLSFKLLEYSINVEAIDGNYEKLTLYSINSLKIPIVLGLPWPKLYSPKYFGAKILLNDMDIKSSNADTSDNADQSDEDSNKFFNIKQNTEAIPDLNPNYYPDTTPIPPPDLNPD
ncbi:hypothetical protein BB561_005115 [Smittium simulii]|uniref:DUF4939 domain-containing protein n=1 Tax=Smittium simulii TaxID=133385 RepID=A0A2T9YC67_9FUNG|nr:hypothetical protein BB561_005115 [Smittium simulii]